MHWNLGDLLDGIDAVMPPDAPALVHGDRCVPWADFAKRSNNLAAALRERGAQPDDKVAFYMRNRTEYMETLAACMKARLVHVNVNFRYLDDELHYILENSDSRFVIFGAEFADRVDHLRTRLPDVVSWIQVNGEPAPYAECYESLATRPHETMRAVYAFAGREFPGEAATREVTSASIGRESNSRLSDAVQVLCLSMLERFDELIERRQACA